MMRRTIGGMIAGALWRWWLWRECVAEDVARQWDDLGQACNEARRAAKTRAAVARSKKNWWVGRRAAERGEAG